MTHTHICRTTLSTVTALVFFGGWQFANGAPNSAATADASRPIGKFVEPPPLDAKIVGMMETNVLGTIEARIYFVEKWDIAPVQKAQALFKMFAQAGGDDQRKIAHAAVSHVGDTNYGLVRKHLLDPKLPRTVLSVLMTDTLKRGYGTKLPVLLSLAQVEEHPMRAESQDLLRRYLGRDHGTNWLKWEETMVTWLKDKPR